MIAFIFASTIALAEVFIPQALYQSKEFSENRLFPVNESFCTDGECTLGGMKRYQLALTFDDGPNRHTEAVLDVLKSWNIKGTFFVHIGQSSLTADKQRILQRIVDEGHSLANHGRSHSPIHRDAPSSTVIDYLMDTHSVIEPLLPDGEMWVYRNPGGYWSAPRARMLNRHPVLRNYVGPIYWNVGGWITRDGGGQFTDAADWQCQRDRIPAQKCAEGYFNKIMRNHSGARNYQSRGSLVLMHDNRPITDSVLEILLQRLQQTRIRWEFVKVQDIPSVQAAAEE